MTGLPSPAQLVGEAVQHNMSSLALTDRNGLTGCVEFYEICIREKIKPILGLELKLNHTHGSGDLVLLAMDRVGWRSLCRISSFLQTHPYRDPERGLDFDTLSNETDGLICLTGGKNGICGTHLEKFDYPNTLWLLCDLKKLFPDRIFIEFEKFSGSVSENIPGGVDAVKRVATITPVTIILKIV